MPQSGGQSLGSGGSNAGNLGSLGSIGGVANGTPTFSDNFSGGIDPSKWGVNYPWGKIQGDSTQYAAYTDSLNSDVFSTGANGLNIAIKPTGLDGKPAETGQIHSKQAFQYGYVEMTATLPTTKGVGGAFWMMPTDGSGTYTELDMMESLGQDPGTVYSTVHDGSGQQQAVVNVPGGVQSPHTYAMDWQPDTTTFYRDGQVTQSFRTPDSAKKPMYIILSVNSTPSSSPSPWGQAVGPGNVSANYNIKNVRVFAKNPYTGG
jgi:beta-glucanase (GH16 family)